MAPQRHPNLQTGKYRRRHPDIHNINFPSSAVGANQLWESYCINLLTEPVLYLPLPKRSWQSFNAKSEAGKYSFRQDSALCVSCFSLESTSPSIQSWTGTLLHPDEPSSLISTQFVQQAVSHDVLSFAKKSGKCVRLFQNSSAFPRPNSEDIG